MPEPANRTIARTFEVLDYLNERQPVRLKEVVRDLGYPASSATVILKSLVVLGYASFDRASMAYTLTPRIAGMAHSLSDRAPPEDQPVIAAARQRLSRLTGGTIGFGIQSDIYAQYLSVVPNRRPMPYRIRPGSVRPITRCGLGLALLSRQSDDAIDRLRRRVNAKENDRRLHIGQAELADHIAGVRERGYAFSLGLFHEGIGFIGIALPKPLAGRWSALGVGGMIPQLAEQEELIVTELKAVAAELLAASP